jgi:hypothetical protein
VVEFIGPVGGHANGGEAGAKPQQLASSHVKAREIMLSNTHFCWIYIQIAWIAVAQSDVAREVL